MHCLCKIEHSNMQFRMIRLIGKKCLRQNLNHFIPNRALSRIGAMATQKRFSQHQHNINNSNKKDRVHKQVRFYRKFIVIILRYYREGYF